MGKEDQTLMFDPTVFENLKVAFENQLYDLDNLAGQIRIINRVDRLDLSVLSREFALRLKLADHGSVHAEIRLEASLKDLAAEILETPDGTPGCALSLRFYLDVEDVKGQCQRIEQILQDIWQPESPPVQTLSFVFGEERVIHTDTVELKFHRQINEEQMGDIPELIEHVLHTLAALEEV
jgi:hypothetical protein